MKLAHLADLHVGFRQFDRMAEKGANQRELDVAEALHRAVDGVLAAKPDAILIAGDVFHQVRPPNGAILRLFGELQRLRVGLPAASVVMIGGDHDTPRSSSAESILGLYRALGVTVVDRGIEVVELPGVNRRGSLRIAAVPRLRAAQFTAWAESTDRAVADVLLLHGEARHVPGAHWTPETFEAGGWEYVALGHWHVCQQVGKRAWYAGALDYTSTDPWAEMRAEAELGRPGKGWLLVELDGIHEPQVTFQPIKPTRRFADLELLDADGLGAAEVDAALAARAAGIDGAVVRQVVLNLSRETKHALDHAAIRGYKGRALNYHLDTRRPAEQAATVAGRAIRMQRLDQIVDEFLGVRELPPDVDRDKLRELGRAYLFGTEGAEDPYNGEVEAPQA